MHVPERASGLPWQRSRRMKDIFGQRLESVLLSFKRDLFTCSFTREVESGDEVEKGFDLTCTRAKVRGDQIEEAFWRSKVIQNGWIGLRNLECDSHYDSTARAIKITEDVIPRKGHRHFVSQA
eukprot:6058885-Amphidinium_carterae.1